MRSRRKCQEFFFYYFEVKFLGDFFNSHTTQGHMNGSWGEVVVSKVSQGKNSLQQNEKPKHETTVF